MARLVEWLKDRSILESFLAGYLIGFLSFAAFMAMLLTMTGCSKSTISNGVVIDARITTSWNYSGASQDTFEVQVRQSFDGKHVWHHVSQNSYYSCRVNAVYPTCLKPLERV